MDIKFNCSNAACRQRIAVDESMADQSIACPGCGTMQQVPVSINVKFNCSGCGQHIMVDVSEAGRFIRCPSCEKPLQVPGSPPRPIISAKPETDKPAYPAPKKQPFQISPWQRLLCGWGMGALLTGILFGALYLRSSAAMPRHMDAMLDEIFTEGRILDAPIANHSGTTLLYAQELNNGIGVFMEDLASLQRRQIQGFNRTEIQGKKVFKLYGWSPGDNYLAMVAVTESTNKDKEVDREIIVCDGASGSQEHVFQIKSTPESGVWLTTNTIVFLTRTHQLVLLNLKTDKHLGRMIKEGFVRGPRLTNSGPYELVATSDHSVAYVDQGNVWNWDISTGNTDQLTHFSDATLEWLDYSPETGKYLFCMSTGNGKNRYVYELAPNTNSVPVQLTDTYSFKGQWLKDGAGFACVRTEGDKSYLTVDSGDPKVFTNLFAGGSIRSYSISPKRDTIYAVASFRYKEQSIWEYGIFDKSSRDVLVQKQTTASASQTVLPVSASAVSGDGETVQYYFVPPSQMISGKKYPVVLDLYPVTRYDQNAQILANAGIYYYAANRYGLTDKLFVAKPGEILAIYNDMLKNPNVDTNRIYICGRSFTTANLTAMVNQYPYLWRGAVLFTPVAFPTIPRNAGKYPSLFIAIGDEDQDSLQTLSDQLWEDACKHSVPARLYYRHAGHDLKTSDYKALNAELVNFIRTDY
jgi:DNA-directed RNA polymerase subunit RPC12/RpoP